MRLRGRMQQRYQFWGEVLLSVGLAMGSSFLALIPPFDHFGGISLALIVGMLVKALLWKQTSPGRSGVRSQDVASGGDRITRDPAEFHSSSRSRAAGSVIRSVHGGSGSLDH